MKNRRAVWSRRRFVALAAGVVGMPLLASFSRNSRAQAPAADAGAPAGGQLPLRSTGLEHVSLWVPDVEQAGRFYGSVFDPQLHREKEPPLRYYVPLGVGYVAIGAANDRPVQIDHYCALVEGYEPRAMAAALASRNLAAGRFGMIPDPDGVQLQLLGVPGGLAKSTEPAPRVSADAPLFRPVGLDHVMVNVADLERALPFYRQFFGTEAERMRSPERVFFQVAGTRLGLQQAPSGEKPRIDHFCVGVAAYERESAAARLRQLGASPQPSAAGEPATLMRFKDPFGITVEVLGST